MAGRAGGVLAVVLALLLLVASAATAATRYAAPGGTGTDPCAKPNKPCSVYTATEETPNSSIKAGDVVELAPGVYHADHEKGEFGFVPSVGVPAGVTVRGEPGKARPIIIVRDNEAYGAFYVPTGAEVADVEIRDRSGRGPALSVSGGTMSRVIVRSTATDEAACDFFSGTMRSSACLNSGGGSAIGFATATKGTYMSVIRNSTLIATGPGAVGMDLNYAALKAGLEVNVDAVGVLVRGEEKDVIVTSYALNRGRGATVDLKFRASNYATVKTTAEDKGRVSITPPGTNGNMTQLALLTRGNLHQLPSSPTVDRGTVDSTSGTLDIDKQPRTIGGLPDIGADEFGFAPSPAVNPAPVTQLGEHPFKRTPVKSTKFTFGSSELGSRYECKVDSQPFRACRSPYRKKLGFGKHSFRVRAVDPQGKFDRTPAVFRWRIRPGRLFIPD